MMGLPSSSWPPPGKTWAYRAAAVRRAERVGGCFMSQARSMRGHTCSLRAPSGSRRHLLAANTASSVGFALMEDARACFRKTDEPGCGEPLQHLPAGAIENLRLQC